MRLQERTLQDRCGRIIIKSYRSVLGAQRRVYREHHHTECELSVFVKGCGTYEVHGKSYDFQPGDVFLFGSDEAHCITEILEDMDVLNIHFEPRLLWEQSDSVELLNLFAARSRDFRHRFRDETLSDLVRRIECEIAEAAACHVITVKYLLYSALAYMIRHYDCIDKAKDIRLGDTQTGSLQRALRYINENLTGTLSLEDIAAEACMTPSYFSSVFKKFNGISPWDYITIKRVELAVELLRTTDMTKLEVLSRCGFQSPSNFYKAFSRVTGKRPGDFARKRG